jgi:hypothetical protein
VLGEGLEYSETNNRAKQAGHDTGKQPDRFVVLDRGIAFDSLGSSATSSKITVSENHPLWWFCRVEV